MSESLINQESSMHQQKKIDFFQRVVPSINARIERGLEDFELKAIAFAVNELYQGSEEVTGKQFIQDKLGVKPEDNPRDASWHIYEKIYHAKETRLNREKEASMLDAEKIDWLNSVAEFMETGYISTQNNYRNGNSESISIGSVMDEWVPQWFSNPQTA